MNQKIQELRKRVLVYINSIALINPSREVSLVNTSLQRSMAWFGKALSATGSKTPYIASEDPTSSKIEPLFDDTTETLADRWINYGTQTARIKDFRAVVQETCNTTVNLNALSMNKRTEHCLQQAYISLEDAKIWLGFEIGRIRKVLDGPIGNPPSPNLPL